MKTIGTYNVYEITNIECVYNLKHTKRET